MYGKISEDCGSSSAASSVNKSEEYERDTLKVAVFHKVLNILCGNEDFGCACRKQPDQLLVLFCSKNRADLFYELCPALCYELWFSVKFKEIHNFCSAEFKELHNLFSVKFKEIHNFCSVEFKELHNLFSVKFKDGTHKKKCKKKEIHIVSHIVKNNNYDDLDTQYSFYSRHFQCLRLQHCTEELLCHVKLQECQQDHSQMTLCLLLWSSCRKELSSPLRRLASVLVQNIVTYRRLAEVCYSLGWVYLWGKSISEKVPVSVLLKEIIILLCKSTQKIIRGFPTHQAKSSASCECLPEAVNMLMFLSDQFCSLPERLCSAASWSNADIEYFLTSSEPCLGNVACVENEAIDFQQRSKITVSDESGNGRPQIIDDESGNGRPQIIGDESGNGGPHIIDVESRNGRPQITDDKSENGRPQIIDVESGNGRPQIIGDESGNGRPQITDDESENERPQIIDVESGNGRPHIIDVESGNGRPHIIDVESGNGRPHIIDVESGNGRPQITDGESETGGPQITDGESESGRPQITEGESGNGRPQITEGESGNGRPQITDDESGNGRPQITDGRSTGNTSKKTVESHCHSNVDDKMSSESILGQGSLDSAAHHVENPSDRHTDSICLQESHQVQSQQLLESSSGSSQKTDTPEAFPESMLNFSLWRSFLGLSMKFDPKEHFPWRQKFEAFPFTKSQQSSMTPPQGDQYSLMSSEVFRISSFVYSRFPPGMDVWVTRLAQSGFFYSSPDQRIICFACGGQFSGSMDSSPEDSHHPQCPRRELNTPLHRWTQGLSQVLMADYYNRYGTLRPHINETIRHTFENADATSHTGAGIGSYESEPTLQQRRQGMDSIQGISIPTSGISERSDSGYSEGRPQYHSENLSALGETTREDLSFGNKPHSLPPNLNDISGAVVSEESQEPCESNQVLTSAARFPRSLHGVHSEDRQSQQTETGNQNPTERGAVGSMDQTLDLRNASYPQFSNATARRETFTTWSPDHSHRPDDLVAGGFFYAGYADCVRCFYCGLGLKYWRRTDIPAYEHARHRPQCVYNRMYKGQEYIDRVQQDVQAQRTQGAANHSSTQNVPTSATGEMVPALVTAARDPDHMNSAAAQEAMRRGWPREQVRQAVNHIVTDIVPGVSTLETDLLLDVLANLHAGDNPEQNLPSGGSTSSGDSGVGENPREPSSLASIRAAPAVNVADSLHGEEVQGAVPHAEGAQRGPPVVRQAAPPTADLMRSVEREHVLLSERTMCRICHTRSVSCIYLPCGHVIACQSCADEATHCLFCSKQIVGTANIFLA